MKFFGNGKKKDCRYYENKVKEYEARLKNIIGAMLEVESAGMLELYRCLGSQYNEIAIEYYDAVSNMNKHMAGCRRHPLFHKDYRQSHRLKQ